MRRLAGLKQLHSSGSLSGRSGRSRRRSSAGEEWAKALGLLGHGSNFAQQMHSHHAAVSEGLPSVRSSCLSGGYVV